MDGSNCLIFIAGAQERESITPEKISHHVGTQTEGNILFTGDSVINGYCGRSILVGTALEYWTAERVLAGSIPGTGPTLRVLK